MVYIINFFPDIVFLNVLSCHIWFSSLMNVKDSEPFHPIQNNRQNKMETSSPMYHRPSTRSVYSCNILGFWYPIIQKTKHQMRGSNGEQSGSYYNEQDTRSGLRVATYTIELPSLNCHMVLSKFHVAWTCQNYSQGILMDPNVSMVVLYVSPPQKLKKCLYNAGYWTGDHLKFWQPFKRQKQKQKTKASVKMQSMKETAANIAASAKAGMEKTKAAVQEKVYDFLFLSPLFFFFLNSPL